MTPLTACSQANHDNVDMNKNNLLSAAAARGAPKPGHPQPSARPSSSSSFSTFGLAQAAPAGKALSQAPRKGTLAGAVPSASTAFPSWGLPQPALATAAPSQGQAKALHAGAAPSSPAAGAAAPRTVAQKAKMPQMPSTSQQKVCILLLLRCCFGVALCMLYNTACCEGSPLTFCMVILDKLWSACDQYSPFMVFDILVIAIHCRMHQRRGRSKRKDQQCLSRMQQRALLSPSRKQQRALLSPSRMQQRVLLSPRRRQQRALRQRALQSQSRRLPKALL